MLRMVEMRKQLSAISKVYKCKQRQVKTSIVIVYFEAYKSYQALDRVSMMTGKHSVTQPETDSVALLREPEKFEEFLII